MRRARDSGSELEAAGKQAGPGTVRGFHVHGARERHQSVQTWDQPQLFELDDDGNCYITTGSGCRSRADFECELKKLEETLKALHATLETPYDDVFVARKREELRREGISLLTLQIEPQERKVH